MLLHLLRKPVTQINNEAEDGQPHRDEDGDDDGRSYSCLVLVVVLLGWKEKKRRRENIHYWRVSIEHDIR